MMRLKVSALTLCFTLLAGLAVSLTYLAFEQPAFAQDATTATAAARTMTVLGVGSASATPDSVKVQLAVGGGNMNYGPGGPEFQPFDEENIKLIEEALVSLEIDPEQISTNPFGRSNFDPFSSAGIVRFTHDEPQELTTFMNELLEVLDDSRGPNIQGASAIFQVDDCLALEAEAMSAAVENAEIRAGKLADVVEATVGQVLSISEQSGSASAPAVSTTCASLDTALNQMGFNPFTSSGGAENSPSNVEVSVAVEVTFTIE